MAIGSDFFEVKDSVLRITDENNIFAISTPGYFPPRRGSETIIKLREMLELREQNDSDLHVEEIR